MSESGRLFVRNLSYTCTEENLQDLFKKYGPLSEVNLPVDKNTNKATGFGFVTFMMPEHSIKALSELDGKIFQGRLLHLLPGRAQKSREIRESSGLFVYFNFETLKIVSKLENNIFYVMLDLKNIIFS